ncbi:MAG: HEAT repeat domain-containing protein [Candidatus Cloacimonetes bacterium]|nr:HEAT repeat domain-containing protein [Candidatus Cloacimonadota bacterium]
MEDALKYHGVLRRLGKKEKLDLIANYLGDEVTESKIATLMDLLGDPAYDLRVAAYKQLQKLKGDIIGTVSDIAVNGSVDQRFWCIRLLTDMGALAVSVLEKCIVTESDSVIRSMIVEGLGAMKSMSSVPLLLPLLKDPDWSMRQKVFFALKGYGDQIFPELEQGAQSDDNDLVYWCVKLLGAMGFKSHTLLYRLLKDADAQTKFLVAAALGESGDRRVMELLVKTLMDKQWILAKRASDALIQIGEMAIPVLVEHLPELKPQQLGWAARTLAGLGSEGILALGDYLVLQDETWLWEARESVMSLERDLIPVLTPLTHKSKPERIRFFAYSLLCEISESYRSQTLNTLASGLRDQAWVNRKLCADALGKIGAEVIEMLRPRLSQSEGEEFHWLCEVFRRFPEGREHLAGFLASQDRSRVSTVLSALKGNIPQSATRSLIQCLASEHWIIRKSAADALIELQIKSLPMVVEALITSDEEQRFWLGKVLKSYSRMVWPHLLSLVYQPGFPGWLCTRAMGIIGDPYFLPGIQEALKGPEPLLVLHACLAYKKLKPLEPMPASFGLLSQLSVKQHPEILELLKDADLLWLAGHLSTGLRQVNELMVENCVIVAGHFRVVAVMEILKRMLKDGSASWPLVVESLLEMGCLEIKPFLQDKLRSEANPKIRTMLLMGIWKLSDGDGIADILETCLKLDTEEQRSWVISEIIKSGVAYIPSLIETLGHQTPAMRRMAAEVLLEFGPMAIADLKLAQMDSDPNRRFMASKILKELASA